MENFHLDRNVATLLLAALAWTTLFSMTIKPGVRGLRNLGLLASYLIPFVMLFFSTFLTVLMTWCVFGVAGGVLYTISDFLSYALNKSSDKTLNASFSTLLHGLFAWPLMIPEAIENSLANFGFFRAPHEKNE